MTLQLKAELFQNPYLPAGGRDVHAILTVTAGESGLPQPTGERLIGVLCDVSGSMEGAKIEAARAAMASMVRMLPADCSFFLIAGADGAHLISPVTRADSYGKEQALRAIAQVRAFGGTRMSNWFRLALDQFRAAPASFRQAILLTDGQNDESDLQPLEAALAQCEGVFQCECRGVGVDWRVDQLRSVASRLLGTVDLIASPQQIEADFGSVLRKALTKTVSKVTLRLWTPQGARVKFCKQVQPDLLDLTSRARNLSPQMREYPTGAWNRGETRDFHLCIEIIPGRVGEEMLASRASLIVTDGSAENKVAEARVLATWTDDESRSTRIDSVVAHYTGQAELASAIQEGLDARACGDLDRATVLLGRAAKLAHDSGNETSTTLLRRVVEVEDIEKGTVRLKRSVSLEDTMALDTRSTRTAGIPRTL